MLHKFIGCFIALLLTAPSLSLANTALIDSPPVSSTADNTPPIYILDEMTAWQLRGRFAPLPFVMGVASLDLALTGLFWGVYVPYYSEEEGPATDQVIISNAER